MSYNVSTNPSCSKFSHINPIIHIPDPRYVCPSKSRSASLRFKSQRMSLTKHRIKMEESWGMHGDAFHSSHLMVFACIYAFWASAQSILSLDGPYMNRLRAFASHNLSVLQRHFRSRPALKTMRVRERIKVSRSTPCKEASSIKQQIL